MASQNRRRPGPCALWWIEDGDRPYAFDLKTPFEAAGRPTRLDARQVRTAEES